MDRDPILASRTFPAGYDGHNVPLVMHVEGGLHYIKMWKASDDGLPIPKSEPKQVFYQQPLFEDGERPEILHLAVIWNINSTNNLSAIWLICPKYGDEKSTEDYWTAKIPDPALAIVSPDFTPPTNDLPIEPRKDSEIKKEERQ